MLSILFFLICGSVMVIALLLKVLKGIADAITALRARIKEVRSRPQVNGYFWDQLQNTKEPP